MPTFQRWLEQHHACAEARAWVGDKDAAEAWALCDRPDWMLWLLDAAGVDYEEAVASARRAYAEAVALARRAYDEAAAPAELAYEEAVASARRAYAEAVALARRAYDEAAAPAELAYVDGIRRAYPCCPVEV